MTDICLWSDKIWSTLFVDDINLLILWPNVCSLGQKMYVIGSETIKVSLRHFVSRNVFFNYYKFYVKPVLQYGLLIYGGNTSSNLDKLVSNNVKWSDWFCSKDDMLASKLTWLNMMFSRWHNLFLRPNQICITKREERTLFRVFLTENCLRGANQEQLECKPQVINWSPKDKTTGAVFPWRPVALIL